jgi:iron complex outermembrane recepter protein
VTYTNILNRSYSAATGAQTANYSKGKPTPAASLIYKPLNWLSTYFSYIEDLESGVAVPMTGSVVYTNAGQILAPYTNRQYEVGAKASVGKALVTMSLFDIEEVLQYAP